MDRPIGRWRSPLAAVLLLTGCASAYATLDPATIDHPPLRERYVVTASTGKWTVDSLRVEGDTLRGSVIGVHPEAPRTPLQIPVATVTGLRRDDSAATGLMLAAIPLALLLVVAMSFAGSGD